MIIQEYLKWQNDKVKAHDVSACSDHSLLGNTDPILMQRPPEPEDKRGECQNKKLKRCQAE